MLSIPQRKTGFTLVELLIVVLIISILLALVLPVMARMRKAARIASATNAMSLMKVALEGYKDEFHEYPPDDENVTEGSEIMWFYLCQRLQVGEKKGEDDKNLVGPFLDAPKDRIVDTGGPIKQLLSPLGTKYQYKYLVDTDGVKRTYILIDPGPDKCLGGSLSKDAGFQMDESADENQDKIADYEDNIYSTTPIKKP